ncbi:uncharacterized protein LOC104848662 isoform X2 [Fukomys damarensis]|uniref:uncharacterized protein LOC104848662 isoform X2 n=1 Tax=Fukomys damarensis TaxID=885580 RepID=UPI001455879B|nr:uncharacterized protein LOC104848662 isoform X2 [Fukomys damarensis]
MPSTKRFQHVIETPEPGEWELSGYEAAVPITEKSNPLTRDLDKADAEKIVQLLGQCDAEIFQEEGQAMPAYQRLYSESVLTTMVQVAGKVQEVLKEPDGGLVVLSGGGTSGRMAFLMSVSFNQLMKGLGQKPLYTYLIAGGDRSVVASREGKEDSALHGIEELKKVAAGKKRVIVIGISAGLSAPFVAGQMGYCMDNTAVFLPVLVGFNPVNMARNDPIEDWNSTFRQVAEQMQKMQEKQEAFVLNPAVGPEGLSGCSRMKGGSTTKILLETLLLAAHKTVDRGIEASPRCLLEILRTFERAHKVTYGQSSKIATLMKQVSTSLEKKGRVHLVGWQTLGIIAIMDGVECIHTFGADFRDIRGFLIGDHSDMFNQKAELTNQGPQFTFSQEDFLTSILPSLTEIDTVIFIFTLDDNLTEVQTLVEQVKEKTSNIQALAHSTVGQSLPAPLKKLFPSIINIMWPLLFFEYEGNFVQKFQRELSTKWVLNTVSTGAHVLLGKILQNHMLDLHISNSKLFWRALALLQRFSGQSKALCIESLLQAIHFPQPLTDEIRAAPISSHIRVALAKEQTSKQHKLKRIRKHTESEEDLRMEWSKDNQSQLSLMELDLPELQDVTSSTTSLLEAQEAAPPCCVCEKAAYSSDHSISSGSSSNSSSLSYPSAFFEGTTGQFQSNSLPVSHRKQTAVFRNQGTSLSPFQLSESEHPEHLQNLEALSHLPPHNSFIDSMFEPPNVCKQEKKTKNKRRRRNHLLLDHGPNSVLNERLQLPGWALSRLSPLARGELEGHMSWKVCTLQEQTVPVPVKKSWAMLNYLIEVPGGAHELENPQTQLSTLTHQSTEQNINNKSPDLPSGLNRTETRISQSLISSTQVTDMQWTPKLPYKVTDNIKITPLALLQVMDSMGLIPESPLQVMESADFFPQAPNQAVKPVEVMEAMHVTPKAPNQITESVEVTPKTQQQVVEPNRMASRLNQVVDNVKITPLALLQVTASKRMINESYPRIIEPLGMTPRPQYQATESMKQAIRPGKMSPMPQHAVMETVEKAPRPKHKVMESVSTTSGSHSQSMEQVKIAVDLIHQNSESLEMTSIPSHQVIDYMKVTPVALLQTMSFTEIPPAQTHDIESGGLSPGSQSQIANLTPRTTQSDVLTSTSSSTAIAPLGVVESVSLPPESTPKMMEARKSLTPSHQSIHSLNVNSVALGLPMVMITKPQSQVIESEGLIPQPVSQGKESLELTSGLKIQVLDAEGVAPSYHQGTESASGLPHQVTDPSRLTPRHQILANSVMSPRQSHKVIEATGLTSDTWLPMKKSVPLTQSHHQIMEPLETIPASLGQGIEFTGMLQKPLHEVTQPAVMTTPSVLQGVKYMGAKPIPQLKLTDSTELSPGLPNVKSKNLILEPALQSMNSVDTTTGLDPQMVNYKQPIPSVKSIDLVPKVQWQSVKSEELAPIPQLQSRKSMDLIPSSQFQGVQRVHLALPPECQDIKMAQVTLRPPLEESKSVELAPKPWLQNTSLEEVAPVLLLKDMKTPQMIECRSSTPQTQVQSMKLGELITGTHLQPIKCVELNPDQNHHATEPEGLTPWNHDSESLGMISELEYQGTVAKLTGDTCHQVEESVGMTQSSLGITTVPLGQTTKSIETSPSSLQDTTGTMFPPVKVVMTPELQRTIEESLNLIPRSEVQSVKSDVLTPGPQLQGVKSRQTDPESHLQDVKCVNLIPQSRRGGVESERPKPEAMVQSVLLKELTKGAELQSVTSVDLNLDPGKSSVKSSGLTPGPQLQSVRFSKLSVGSLQGEKPVDLISGPPHDGVVPDERTPSSPIQEIKLLDFIPGSKYPSVKSAQLTPVDLTSGPCLQDVKVSDLILEPKHSGLKPGAQLQDTKSVKFVTESSLQLNQGLQVEDKKSVLSTEGSHFHSIKPMILTSELQFQDMKSEEVNQGQKDTNFSKLVLGPKLQDVTLGEQTHDVNSVVVTPELGQHDSKLAKMSFGFQDMKQVGLHQGPWLQDVKIFNLIPGTQPPSMKSSELSSGPPLQCRKILELTSQPERQGVKPQLLVPESRFQDVKYVTANQVPSFEGDISYKLVSEPRLPNVESMESKMGTQLPCATCSESTRGQQSQGMKYSELIQEPQLEDIKPGEQIPVSWFQGLKSGKLISEPQPEDNTSVELILRAHLGGMKSKKLTPKREPGEVKSMVLSPGPQTRGIKAGDLAPGSELQGLKSELIPLGSQLNDKKSVVLTPGPCPEGMKSTELTSSPQLKVSKSVEVTPGSRIQDLKTEELVPGTKVQDMKVMELKLGPKMQGGDSVAFPSDPLVQFVKSKEVLQRPQLQSMKPEELISEPQMQDMKLVTITPLIKLQNLKSVKDTPGSQLHCEKSVKLAPRPKRQEAKSVSVTRRQQFQGIKSVDLDPKQRFQGVTPVSLTLDPGQDGQVFVNLPGWKHVNLEQLTKGFESDSIVSLELVPEPKSKGMKSVHLNSQIQLKNMKPFELAPEPDIQDVRAKALKYESQLPSRKPPKLTPGPQLQEMKTVELIGEPQTGSMKTIQWLSRPEFQRVTSVGLNLASKSQGFKLEELKSSTQSGRVKSSELTLGPKLPGTKSAEFNPKSQLQCVKTSEWFPGQWLQNRKTLASTSEPQLQGMETVELNKEPQVGNRKSLQWIPGPEFQGVKSIALNLKTRSRHIKPTRSKSSIQPGSMKSSKLTLGPKLQDEKFMKFDLGPQEQRGKSPELFPGSDRQKGKHFGSTSEPQLQERKSAEIYQGSQLGSMRTIEWMPGPEFQVIKSVLSLGPQSQGVTALELKASKQLREVKTSELPPTSKLQCIQSLASLQEYQLHGFKPSDLKSEPEFRSMKSHDATSRPKLCDVKSMVFNPQLHLQDVKSELTPGLQLQVKPLESSPGTQLRCTKSVVFMQEPQLQEEKSRILSQQPQLQSDKIVELNSLLPLKSTKSPELALQTKPQGMKSEEINSGPPWQSTKCSKLTPKTKSQYKKCIQLSPSSQLKGTPFSDLTMEKKIQGVKSTDFKPQPQSEGVKSSESIPRTKLQETKLLEFNSGPQLQDMKSSRLIMGTKLQDTKSMDFSSEPHLQGEKSSEVILGEKLQGVKYVEIKSSPKLPCDCILGKDFPGMKSGQHFKSKKAFEAAPGTKLQDSNFGPQIQSQKSSELVQGTKFQDVKSIEFNHGLKLQDTTSALIPKTKLEGGESAKFYLGPQLQDVKYSKLIPGTQFKHIKSIEFPSRPYLQGAKSVIIPETKLQKEKCVRVMSQLLQQDIKSFQVTLSKTQDRKSLRSNSAPPFQNRKLSILIPQIYDESMQSVEFNPSIELQGVKCESINHPTMNYTGVNDGSEESSELKPTTELQDIKSEVLCLEPHLQGINSSAPIPGPKLQCANSTGCNPEPYL